MMEFKRWKRAKFSTNEEEDALQSDISCVYYTPARMRPAMQCHCQASKHRCIAFGALRIAWQCV